MSVKKIIRVFIASPSDVKEERLVLPNIIQEINFTLGDVKNFRLELIKWETHSYPSIGTDAQAVINKQISDNYEIFIGIMGTRFGSQTKNAGSGTEEEFERAYSRYIRNPKSLRIMFYFKNPIVKLWDIDLEQAILVKEFKTKLEHKGGFYWIFNTIEEFKDSVRVHLIKQVESLLKNELPPTKINKVKNASRISKKLNTWIATTNNSTPQWADYKEIPLKGKHFKSFNCNLSSSSDYFRFGFKFLRKQGKLFGDGSIQSQDNNFLIHIGKNHDSNTLFITTYSNGIRHRPDKYIKFSISERPFKIGLIIDNEDFLHFMIENKVMHKVRLNKEILENVYMLAWGDSGNEYSVRVSEIEYGITND